MTETGKNDTATGRILKKNPYRPYDNRSERWAWQDKAIAQVKHVLESYLAQRVLQLVGKPGSGKTAALKRIEENPGLLGDKYVPVYLDFTKYIDFHPKNILSAIAKDLIAILEKRDEVDDFDLFYVSRPKEYTLESLLLAIDTFLKENYVLVLLCDKFDDFLRSIDVSVVSNFIDQLSRIEKNWNNYVAILAGDRNTFDNFVKWPYTELLKDNFIIELERFFDEKEADRAILEPAKDRDIRFDTGIVNKIKYYSGGNPFFLQLICFHIVDYIDNEIKPEDGIPYFMTEYLEAALRRILEKESEKFDYSWKNKFDSRHRFLASALADSDICRKIENVFKFEKSRLIENIIGKEKLSALEEDIPSGYFHKMEKWIFEKYPFRIPIIGLWVRKNHPFIRVIFEHIDMISEYIDLHPLHRAIESTSPIKLVPFSKEQILTLSEKWLKLHDSLIKRHRSEYNENRLLFVKVFAEQVDIELKDDCDGVSRFISLDIKNLNIGTLEQTLCFFQEAPGLSNEDVKNIENVIISEVSDRQTTLILFFYFERSSSLENVVRSSYLNFVAIGENDFKKIAISKRPLDSFKRHVLSQLSLQQVSPYQIVGPAQATFFGRIELLKQMSQNAGAISYTVVGGRKIGKSSLLFKLPDNLPPSLDCIIMDLEMVFSSATVNYTDFLRSLQIELQEKYTTKVNFKKMGWYYDLSQIPHVIETLTKGKEKLLLIFDEVDSLIEFDKKNKYRLIKLFRGMAKKKICQFAFAGFKELYYSKRSIDSPFYNFAEEIRLLPLDREASMNLMTKPMENLGIKYKNEEDKEIILFYTAGHPNLIQFFCKRLVENIGKHHRIEDRRIIFRDDIEKLFDNEYQKYVVDEVYMFFSDLDSMERLIIILLTEVIERDIFEKQNRVKLPIEKFPDQANHYFSISQIKDMLADNRIDVSIEQVYQYISNMVMRFIFVEGEVDKYRFALPVFPEIVFKRIDKIYKEKSIKEVRENA